MQIVIDRQSNISVREQVYLEISQRIRSGLLEMGTKLPSVRDLAGDLGISLVTAHEIYRRLGDSRLVDTIPGKGTFVRRFVVNGAGVEQEAPFDWQLSIPDYLPRAGLWSQSSVRLPKDILNLAEASVHHTLLPLEFIQASIRTSLTAFPETLGCYSHFKGDTEFLSVLTDYLACLSISLKPHQLLVTNGTQQGINLFAQTFLGPQDILAVETPCFSGAIDAFRLSHARLQPIPVDAEGLRVDILEDLSPQIKLKAIYTGKIRQELL